MENKSKGKAVERIYALLDERSFVEIGQAVTASRDSIGWGCNRIWTDQWMSSLCIQSGCPGTWWFHRRNACKKDRKSL